MGTDGGEFTHCDNLQVMVKLNDVQQGMGAVMKSGTAVDIENVIALRDFRLFPNWIPLSTSILQFPTIKEMQNPPNSALQTICRHAQHVQLDDVCSTVQQLT